ncbi:MAG: HAMP domain-containing histidine kinase [Methylocystaceae bacterium]|nr:HAMP domain-containing histidine kinase [Methylocystaceae bacterium]
MNWRRETYSTLLDQAYKGAIPTSLFTTTAALLFVLMLHQQLPVLGLSIWLTLFLTAQIFRVGFSLYRNRKKDNKPYRYWKKYLYISMLPSSFLWGLFPLLTFHHIDNMERTIITIFLSTAPTGQLLSLVGTLRAWLASMLCMLLPLSFAWFSMGNDGAILGVIGLLYATYLYALAKKFHQTTGDAIELRFQADAASKAKSTFLATASHDLRQPLHAITMSIAAAQTRLTEEYPSKEDISSALKSLKTADTSTEGLSRLLNALLDISKLESGGIKPNFAKVSINTLFKQVANTFGPIAKEKGLDLRFVPSSLHIHSDPILLQRIVGNLVSNAVTHVPTGRILVGCRRHKDRIIINVFDTGPGIPPEKFRDIFKEFNQLDNPGRQSWAGQGLGLSIADRMARTLGHTLSVSSLPDQGSRFSLEVSSTTEDGQQETAANSGKIQNRRSHLIVVIIPNSVILDETSIQIRQWGYRVLAFLSFEEAKELKIRPQMIICAQNFVQGLNGKEIINMLHGIWKTDAPAILLASGTDPAHLGEAEDNKTVILSNPPDPQDFKQTIQDLLSKT